MDVKQFRINFESYFPVSEHGRVSVHFEDSYTRSYFDPCFDVEGMASLKKLKLLNIAFANLPEQESYFELGTYHGKSLISAMLSNPQRQAFACDNFSEFASNNSLKILQSNLDKYGFKDRVTIFDNDFREILKQDLIGKPIGVYFNDGPHDEQSQFDAVTTIEPFLADTSLMIVDDWRLASDSQSYAEAGTRRAIANSVHHWTMLYALPARFNGDQGLWWNGVTVWSFQRR